MNIEMQKGRRLSRLNRIREKMGASNDNKPFIDAPKIPASDESKIWNAYGIKSNKPTVKKPEIPTA